MNLNRRWRMTESSLRMHVFVYFNKCSRPTFAVDDSEGKDDHEQA